MKVIYKAIFSFIILSWFNFNSFSQATLTIGTVSGTPGTSINVPIQVTGITDMTGFQFTITYDKTKLTYINCTNWVTGLNPSQVQINPLDGKLTFVYTDAAINIANGKFFDLNFTVLNGTSGNAAISWSDIPTQRELSNSIPNEISCGYSNGAVVISVASLLLAPVANTATNITQTSFSANWNSSAAATGYRLDVALDNGFTNYLPGFQNKDVGNVTTLQISGCLANTNYYYRIKAYNTGETSGASNSIGLTTLQSSTLVTPVATAASNITQTSFSANWNSSATATGYRLDVALDNSFTNYLTGYQNKDVGNVTTFQISGCLANTIYYYRVKAYKTAETSGVSNSIGLTTLQSSTLVPPVAIAATNISQTSFSANWNSSATATGYRLDVALDNGFTNYLTGYQNKDVGNVTTFQISGCLANTIYYYRVKAYKTAETSGVSNSISATTLSTQTGATLTIGNVTGTSGNTISIPVVATNLSDVVGFQFTIVYDKTKLTYINCSNWVSGLNASQIQINSLDGKLTFVYTDAAINIVNGKFFDLNFTVLNGTTGNAAISWSDSPTQKELSNSIPNEITCNYVNGTVSISNCNEPGMPTSVIGVATGQTTANLSWSTGSPTGSLIETYYWVVGTSATVTYGSGIDQGSTNGTSATVSGLSSGTTYILRVYANTNCNNTSSLYGTSTAFTTLIDCITPTNQANSINFSNVSTNSMMANWTNGNGSRRIVKINTSNSFTAPGNGTDPTANAAYSGSGEQVVYNGSNNNVTITELSAGTTYWFRVYESNCTGSSSLYTTVSATGNPISQMSDVKGPAIKSMSPNNETIIDNHPTFKLIFNKNVEIGSGYLRIIKKGSTIPALSIQLNGLMINWNEVTVSYEKNSKGLDINQEYYILIDKGAFRDYYGNAFEGITNNSMWQFKTGNDYMTGSVSNSQQNKIKIYPNPTRGQIEIDDLPIFNESLISVFDLAGRLITQRKVNSKKIKLDTSSQKSGIYLLVVKNDQTEIFKIIKE